MKETPFALISPSPYPRQLSTHLATLSTTSSTKTTLPVGKYIETSHLKLFTLQTLRILTPLLSTTHSLCSCLLTLQPTLPGTPHQYPRLLPSLTIRCIHRGRTAASDQGNVLPLPHPVLGQTNMNPLSSTSADPHQASLLFYSALSPVFVMSK